MLKIPRGQALQNGTYFVGYAQKIWFTCPRCGLLGVLDHEVADDGVVSPSVVCANPDCDFHDQIQLEDWPDG